MKSAALWGVVLGAAAALFPAVAFLGCLVLLTAVFVRRCAAPEDGRFLLTLFLLGFAVRMAVSLGLDAGSRLVEGRWPAVLGPVSGWEINVADDTRRYLKMGDSDLNSHRAYAMSRYFHGDREVGTLVRMKNPRPHGYLFPMALFYSLFGFRPLTVKAINCLIGALIGVAVFFLARRCFDRAAARWSSALVTFFPSLILWSASNLKDPSFILLSVFLILWVIRIQESTRPAEFLRNMAFFTLLLAAHMTLRSDRVFSSLLAGCALAGYVVWRLPASLRLGLAVCLLIAAGLFWSRGVEALGPLVYRHMGNVDPTINLYSLTYKYLPERMYGPNGSQLFSPMMKSNPLLLFQTVGRAVHHYLFEPFPARLGKLSLLLVYPQMVVWYALAPFMPLGIAVALRRNFKNTFFLIATLAAWTLLAALASGNVGLVFRIRDMVTPFAILLAVVGAQVIWRAGDGAH